MQMLRQSIRLKSAQEIEAMRLPNRLVAQALVLAQKAVRPGVTTGEIDKIVADFFASHNAKPLFLGYPGKVPFPAVCCISVNDEVVHGIPGKRVLKDGDLLKIDTGCQINGWCGDSAVTLPVGKLSSEVQRLHDVSHEALALAIREAGKQRKWSQVALRIQEYVRSEGYSLVEQFVGHGIGRSMHEEPQVPNYVSRSWLRHDFWLDPGLVIAIEPMVNMGTKKVTVKNDHWTVCTADNLPSCHVEHTVAFTEKGIEILTSREGLN